MYHIPLSISDSLSTSLQFLGKKDPPKALGLYMEQDVATSIPVVAMTFLERSFSWRIHLRIFSSSPFQVGLFLITETISHITNFPTCSDWYKPIFFGPAPFALVVPVAAFTRLAFSYTFPLFLPPQAKDQRLATP